MTERIGITGSRVITQRHVERIQRIIDGLPDDTIIITGGCVGVDAYAARFARAKGYAVHVVLPANRSRVDPDWKDYCTSYELMPNDTDYRARNARVVKRAHRLIAFPLDPEAHPRSLRSGTWQTIRMARRANKPVDVHLLNTPVCA